MADLMPQAESGDVEPRKLAKKETFSPVVAAVRAALSRGADNAVGPLLSGAAEHDIAHGQLLRSRFLRQRRRFNDALIALEAAKTAAAKARGPLVVFQEGSDFLMQMRQTEEALALIDVGLDILSDDPGLILRKARALAALGNVDGAKEIISLTDILSRVTPKESSALVNLVRSAHSADAEFGVYIADRVTEASESFPDISRLRGDLAVRAKDAELAQRHYGAALRNYPEGKKGNVAKAIVDFYDKSLIPADDLREMASSVLSGTKGSKSLSDFRVAAITNVYNEKFNLPAWLSHYGAQVGIENCIVLDHGSDDGSTDDLRGAGVMRLPRGKLYNERDRMALINNLANNLLGYYDAVIYTDCDEFLIADPAKYENLKDYAWKMKRPVVHAVGLNVRHDISTEPDLDISQRILEQRTLVQFVSPMCKPLIIRAPISWGGGFHSCEHPPHFDDVYLFHLRHADLRQALDRLKVTREIKFAREGGGRHHRRDEQELIEKVYEKVEKMPVVESFDFSEQITKHIAGTDLSFSGRYAVFKGVNVPHLNRIPERFRIF